MLSRAPATGIIAVLIMLTAALLAACGTATERLQVRIDGSSTVFTITEIMAYEFRKTNPNVRVTIGVSGTGGGFQKWLRRETDINNASRPITPGEAARAREAGFEPVEIPVALDGITLVVNGDNDWVQCLTLDQVREIWKEGTSVTTWRDVNPAWPDEPIILYGPGTDSGTFDYFSEVVIESQEGTYHTTNYSASEDDHVLVQGVIGDLYSLGYMGYAHYLENRDRLRAVSIDGGQGCVEPTIENIRSNLYSPLSRPVFLYVSDEALERPEVNSFIRFYLENAEAFVPQAGFVPLPPEQYEKGLLDIAR